MGPQWIIRSLILSVYHARITDGHTFIDCSCYFCYTCKIIVLLSDSEAIDAHEWASHTHSGKEAPRNNTCSALHMWRRSCCMHTNMYNAILRVVRSIAENGVPRDNKKVTKLYLSGLRTIPWATNGEYQDHALETTTVSHAQTCDTRLSQVCFPTIGETRYI